MRLNARLPSDAIKAAFEPHLASNQTKIALAVSGGSDSIALAHLAIEACAGRGTEIVVMTVDHNLRPESRREAERVAAWCDHLGVTHRLLHWENPQEAVGNLSSAARDARYALMQADCKQLGINALYTGHTLDDQAETVLMRLARGSGVDGLSAMAKIKIRAGGITLHRPLLGFTRDQLRGHLTAIGQGGIDDPTNEDETYDRVKARQMLETLAPLGLTKERLAATARMMGLARTALEVQAGDLHDVWDWSPLGFAQTDSAEFFALPREIALRRLSGVLKALTGATYRPRLQGLEALMDHISEGGRTLHGCIVRRRGDKIVIMREPNAITDRENPGKSPILWDNRFEIDLTGPLDEGLMIAPLGEAGLQQIPLKTKDLPQVWRDAPHVARVATPALWRGDVLVSAPLAPWKAHSDGPELHVKAIWGK